MEEEEELSERDVTNSWACEKAEKEAHDLLLEFPTTISKDSKESKFCGIDESLKVTNHESVGHSSEWVLM